MSSEEGDEKSGETSLSLKKLFHFKLRTTDKKIALGRNKLCAMVYFFEGINRKENISYKSVNCAIGNVWGRLSTSYHGEGES